MRLIIRLVLFALTLTPTAVQAGCPQQCIASWEAPTTNADGGPANVTGYRLYLNGTAIADIPTDSSPSGTSRMEAALPPLADGEYIASVTAFDDDGVESPHSAPFKFVIGPPPFILLLVSPNATRENYAVLDNATLSGDVFIFTPMLPFVVTEIRYFLDDPDMVGPPRHIEGSVPFDFAGTLADGTAAAFDTRNLEDGAHVIIAAVVDAGGATYFVEAAFQVSNAVR